MTAEQAAATPAAQAPANPYSPVKAVLEKVIDETPLIKSFVLKPDKPIDWVTGQFVEIAVPGVGEAPYTPSSNQKDKERLEVTVMKAGVVTAKMHELEAGATLGIRGPLGKGYPLPDWHGKQLLILGGGVATEFMWSIQRRRPGYIVHQRRTIVSTPVRWRYC